MKHKHCDLIHAWADGESIQYFHDGEWKDCAFNVIPTFHPDHQYRIKPKKPEPIFRYMFVEINPSLDNAYNKPNLRLEFDPLTEKLVEACIWDAEKKQCTKNSKKNNGSEN